MDNCWAAFEERFSRSCSVNFSLIFVFTAMMDLLVLLGMGGVWLRKQMENLWWFWTTWTDCVKPSGSDDVFLSLFSVMLELNINTTELVSVSEQQLRLWWNCSATALLSLPVSGGVTEKLKTSHHCTWIQSNLINCHVYVYMWCMSMISICADSNVCWS